MRSILFIRLSVLKSTATCELHSRSSLILLLTSQPRFVLRHSLASMTTMLSYYSTTSMAISLCRSFVDDPLFSVSVLRPSRSPKSLIGLTVGHAVARLCGFVCVFLRVDRSLAHHRGYPCPSLTHTRLELSLFGAPLYLGIDTSGSSLRVNPAQHKYS